MQGWGRGAESRQWQGWGGRLTWASSTLQGAPEDEAADQLGQHATQ